jgi:hypothetical protein
MDHLEPPAGHRRVVLSDDVLDRIDDSVAPGVTLNPADNGGSAHRCSPAPAACGHRRGSFTGYLDDVVCVCMYGLRHAGRAGR